MQHYLLTRDELQELISFVNGHGSEELSLDDYTCQGETHEEDMPTSPIGSRRVCNPSGGTNES